jgi:hypothetical protein
VRDRPGLFGLGAIIQVTEDVQAAGNLTSLSLALSRVNFGGAVLIMGKGALTCENVGI